MPALDVLAAQLQDNPHTYANDVGAVNRFVDDLSEPFASVIADVYIDKAVLALTNASGYPVGHLVWHSDEDAFVFVAAGASFEEES